MPSMDVAQPENPSIKALVSSRFLQLKTRRKLMAIRTDGSSFEGQGY